MLRSLRLSSLAVLGLVVSLTSTSGNANAASSESFHFQPGQTLKFSLDGQVYRSIYETRSYETTCYRTEYETVYRQVCTPRTRESCSSVPVCRDVMRPICDASGCTDYLTRECTTETSCTTVSDGEDCSTVPETISHQIPYSCTQTETIKVGERFDHGEHGNFEISFVGDGVESQADQFRISVADGVDAGSGYDIRSTRTSGNHLFLLRRTNDRSADKMSEEHHTYDAKFEIQAVSVDQLIRDTKIKVTKMGFTSQKVTFDLSATPAPSYSVDLSIQKDKFIGGSKALFQRRMTAEEMKVTRNADGTLHYEIDLTRFGLSFNKRPHIARVTVGLDLAAIFPGETLLNTADEAKVQQRLRSSRAIKKRVR